MTAEIVVMNKIAVALAADSAASVRLLSGHEPRGIKVYSANKLFRLAHELPVGVLIYGSSEFMGVPWEVLIKEYRSTLRNRPKDTLADYADGFEAFLRQQTWLSSDDAPKLIATSEMLGYVGQFVERLASEMSNQFNALIATIKTDGPVNLAEHLKPAPETLRVLAAQRIKDEHERLTTLPKFEGLTPEIEKRILDEYRPDAQQLVQRLMAQQPAFTIIADHYTEISGALTELALLPLVHQPRADLSSGVVFAGFGSKDNFPSMKAISYRGILSGFLQRKVDSKRSDSVSRTRPAVVVGLAQADMIHTFMFGADPDLQRDWTNAFSAFVGGIAPFVEKALTEAKVSDANKLADALRGSLNQAATDMLNGLAVAQRKDHADPFIQLVGFLSKDEMAELAESLIRLTSLKRRVTMAEETVGGPIDVAVISRGEGFVYVKRKHYFDLKLNPHYARMFEEKDDETQEPRKTSSRQRASRPRKGK